MPRAFHPNVYFYNSYVCSAPVEVIFFLARHTAPFRFLCPIIYRTANEPAVICAPGFAVCLPISLVSTCASRTRCPRHAAALGMSHVVVVRSDRSPDVRRAGGPRAETDFELPARRITRAAGATGMRRPRAAVSQDPVTFRTDPGGRARSRGCDGRPPAAPHAVRYELFILLLHTRLLG